MIKHGLSHPGPTKCKNRNMGPLWLASSSMLFLQVSVGVPVGVPVSVSVGVPAGVQGTHLSGWHAITKPRPWTPGPVVVH